MEFFEYVQSNWPEIWSKVVEHIYLTLISVGIAIIIGVPLGILIAYVKKLNKPILGAANIMQAIPSLALLGFLIPFFGIGKVPAIITVILYSLLPIIKNTFTGINNIHPETIEAARGIGLTKFQILTKIQIPQALPVIMAGVRISAVTAVGLMTIAAFIGAGGLGYLVFAGIRTVNNNQILAGAVPACLLALFVDYFVAMIERVVTPISILPGNRHKNEIRIKWNKRAICVFALVIVVVVGNMAYNTLIIGQDGKKTIVVGSKDYTEAEVLGNLVSEIIENNTDIVVERQLSLGGSSIIFSALDNAELDLYMDYTGTAYSFLLKHDFVPGETNIYPVIKKEMKEKYGIDVLPETAFNDTYVLAMTPEMADKYNLNTISDMAKIADRLKSGTTIEFLNREDGLSGLEKMYGFKMGETVGIDGGARYIATVNGETDVLDAYSTGGLLKKFDLKVLEDDKGFFPPYHGIPLIREEINEKYPEIAPLLKKMGKVLDNDKMMDLNYRVDELGEAPRDVAIDFLKQENLID